MRVTPIDATYKPTNQLRDNPYKHGFADGLLGHPCCSPWKDGGLQAMGKNAAYLRGFMAGAKERGKQ